MMYYYKNTDGHHSNDVLVKGKELNITMEINKMVLRANTNMQITLTKQINNTNPN